MALLQVPGTRKKKRSVQMISRPDKGPQPEAPRSTGKKNPCCCRAAVTASLACVLLGSDWEEKEDPDTDKGSETQQNPGGEQDTSGGQQEEEGEAGEELNYNCEEEEMYCLLPFSGVEWSGLMCGLAAAVLCSAVLGPPPGELDDIPGGRSAKLHISAKINNRDLEASRLRQRVTELKFHVEKLTRENQGLKKAIAKVESEKKVQEGLLNLQMKQEKMRLLRRCQGMLATSDKDQVLRWLENRCSEAEGEVEEEKESFNSHFVKKIQELEMDNRR
eukprot:Sspe_Gene.80344::Locus_50682_Transcript_1_1_Confidence_1.000_Length_1486::g.80344::m.80344